MAVKTINPRRIQAEGFVYEEAVLRQMDRINALVFRGGMTSDALQTLQNNIIAFESILSLAIDTKYEEAVQDFKDNLTKYDITTQTGRTAHFQNLMDWYKTAIKYCFPRIGIRFARSGASVWGKGVLKPIEEEVLGSFEGDAEDAEDANLDAE